jgi:hypothetical protein
VTLTSCRLLETRGSLIVRKLCVLLHARAVYVAFARVLRGHAGNGFDFISATVSSSLSATSTTTSIGGGLDGGSTLASVAAMALGSDGFASLFVQTLHVILLTANELVRERFFLMPCCLNDRVISSAYFTSRVCVWCICVCIYSRLNFDQR